MSSDTPPTRKPTRSSRKSTSLRTQRSRSATSDVSQSLLEDITLSAAPTSKEIAGESADEAQREEKSEQVRLGTKLPGDTEVRDTDAAPSDPTSAKEVLPYATDRDEGEDRLNMDTGAKAQTPMDGMKTDNPTGNKDTAEKASNLQDSTLEKSWEVIMKEVTALDEGLVGGWKEDIDTLLVFAGLFSAVVTAFTVESYQWLQEAPEDTAVALLKQISQQMNGSSISQSGSDEFTVSSSVVAINVLWFLSLILALVDALFALLCKQWLREHRRHTHTRTPSEALALRWLRRQSLEKWRVPEILASLPMLLELALLLFLAGLLELLRTRHPVPFAIATIVVALAAIFYFGTTIIPAVNIARQVLQVVQNLGFERNNPKTFPPSFFIMTLPPMEYICPYKSPQAWAAFQTLTRLLLSPIFGPLYRTAWFLQDRGYIAHSTYRRVIRHSAFGQIISKLSDWSSVDLELLQRADIELAPPLYELNAFRWLVAEHRDSPHMIPHLRKVLSTIPLHLVMPVVFDQWFFLPGREWTVNDIEAALAPNLIRRGIDGHLTYAKRQFLTQDRGTQLFNCLLHWIHVSMDGGDDRTDSTRASPNLFPVPFRSVDANPDHGLRVRLWGMYAYIIQNSAASDFYWTTLMEDLAPYIIASSPDYALHLPTATTTSLLVGSAVGCEFLSKIHGTILERKLFETETLREDSATNWIEAMDILRRVHGFPENHLKPIPGHFSLPLTKLRKTLDSLSPTDPSNDFQYLDEFSRGWGDANEQNRRELVRILLEHINGYSESDAEPSHCPDKPNISPIVMSSAGLELIAFVNNRLAENSGNPRWLPGFATSRAYPTKVDSPVSDEHPSLRESEVEPQEGHPDGSSRDVTNIGEVTHDADETNGRSNPAAEPSPRPATRDLDEQGLFVDGGTYKQESKSREPVVMGDPATTSSSTSSAVRGEKMVGGPDADKNV
ncbi:hypothetical protein PQX77_018974 [Marasmius sp. AFHP31]|nr:hypothetical protein PQX77_018974 [Marasmius sp. AFHP31]